MDIRFAKPAATRQLQITVGEPLDASVRALNAFNAEVFQAAASFADRVETDTVCEPVALADIEPLVVKLAPMLSRDLVYALRSAYSGGAEAPNTLLLQVALQGCINHCADRFVNSWYPFQWEQGDFLQMLHVRIQDTGNKDAARAWRTTTKALLRLTSESHPQLLAYMRDVLGDLLAVVGRSRSQAAVDVLFAGFQEHFSDIARLAMRLHILFNDILFHDAPCDLAVCVARPDAEFAAAHMEESYPEAEEGGLDLLADNRVVCVTELGLQRVGGDGALVIVKPKVIPYL